MKLVTSCFKLVLKLNDDLGQPSSKNTKSIEKSFFHYFYFIRVNSLLYELVLCLVANVYNFKS